MRDPSSSNPSRPAVHAAVQAARDGGLRFAEPVVLRDGSNLLVHLSPAPVVARVATVTGTVRRGDGWLMREVAVSRYLADVGAPVVSPSREVPPGPHHRDGFTLTFWEYVEELSRPPDAFEAGRALRTCHEALRDFPGELPRMAALDEAERLVDREDTFYGPAAWDLGCLHASAPPFGRQDPTRITAVYRGYDDRLPSEVLEAFVEVRRFQVAVWTLVMDLPGPEGRQRTRERLAWLRERDHHRRCDDAAG